MADVPGETGFPRGMAGRRVAAAAAASLPSQPDSGSIKEERWQFVLSGKASPSKSSA
jgi:hypothetical protein